MIINWTFGGEDMSQAKVDEYKANKNKRKQISKKERTTRVVWTIVVIAVLVAVAAFLVLSLVFKIF